MGTVTVSLPCSRVPAKAARFSANCGAPTGLGVVASVLGVPTDQGFQASSLLPRALALCLKQGPWRIRRISTLALSCFGRFLG